MGFLKKIIDKIKSKKTLSEKIKKKNQENINNIYDSKIVEQKKFDDGLKKSSKGLTSAIKEMSKKYTQINDELFENIEEILISFDIGVGPAEKIVEAIKEEVKYQKVTSPELIKEIILDKILVYYIQETEVNVDLNLEDGRTNIILVSGVNGVGKTTTIAKLANSFKKDGKKVLLVAGDTFRAGAIEQLKEWAEKIKVDIEVPEKYGQDPSGVIYKGVKRGKEENYDVVICDTSGRLQNKVHLMEELRKITNVIKKFDDTAPHEFLLVLDATTGQSGLLQAKAFKEISDITGIVLTKMDGTSKGGIILAIKDIFNIPVKYIGLGEKLDDLSVFDLEKFILGLTKEMEIE